MTSKLLAILTLFCCSIVCVPELLAEGQSWSDGVMKSSLAASVSPGAVSQLADFSGMLAQTNWPPYQNSGGTHSITRGPGGYFSWIKMLLVVIVFLVWVKLTDRLNIHAQKFSTHTKQVAEIWNPLVVLSFLAGLVAVFAVPLFMAGFPLFCALAFLPYTIYCLQCRGRVPDDAATGDLFTENISSSTTSPIEVKPAGSKDDSQARLIKARQAPQYDDTCTLLHDAVGSRIEQILFDYTKDQVSHRIQVDGLWHPMPPMDREHGDGMLWVLKNFAGLNPSERRQKQQGIFNARVKREKVMFDMTSQGVKTGERVLIKIAPEESISLELSDLGMLPEMQKALLDHVSSCGMIVVSSPPGQGLTSSWQGLLNNADRFTRDFVGVSDFDDRETDRENINMQNIDSRNGESAAELLKGMALKEPNVYVMPKITHQETMDLLIDQVNTDNRTVITRIQANSAVEALLRLMVLSGNREAFARSVTAVTCQRLVRKLCDKCKRPVQANPQAIQQMGGNPQVHKVLYKDYQLPPVEARVDAEGKPIEMEPCQACSGIGFVGRTAIYELLVVNQAIRDVLLKNPKLEQVGNVARQQGHLTLLQQAYRAALEGRTCVPEIQRVFQAKR